MKEKQLFKKLIGIIGIGSILSTTFVGAVEVPNDMVLVPGGSFIMGVDRAVNDLPQLFVPLFKLVFPLLV